MGRKARQADGEEGGGGKSKRGGKKRVGQGGPEEVELISDDEDCGGVPVDSVVKIWCVHSTPNFSLPWQRRRQQRSSGSGFCIDAERRIILTNAHCIEWNVQVKVQRRGSDRKHLARVLQVGWECDCAVLKVEEDEDEFWDGMQVVQLSGKVPHLEEPVLCVGFPVGGDTISVTSGVVSRVEVMTYAQASTELLGIQIDAAINSGNSGGPAFNNDGECLGMAFQSINSDQAENIGYVIPTVVIMHFLSDLLKHGGYTGFPTLGIESQTMENAHLRESFGMGPKCKGLLVRRVAPTSAASQVLKTNDVLLSFDGEQIANDGTISFRRHERVAFSWLVAQKYYHQEATMSVLRDGEVVNLKIPDFYPECALVPVHLFNQRHHGPSYLIVAGLVFTTISIPFLRSEFGEEWDLEAPVEIVSPVMNQRAEFKGEQMVVLTQVLANDLTVGYEDLENLLLKEVNGVAVKNLRHLKELVEETSDTYLRLGLQTSLVLVLRTDAARSATAQVLEQHSIPAAMSPDLADATISVDPAASAGAPSRQ